MSNYDQVRDVTDRWDLVGIYDPTAEEIIPLGGETEGTIIGSFIFNFVWNTSTMEWERMTQPIVNIDNLIVEVDDIEELIDDQLNGYKIDDFDLSGDPVYVGYQDKTGRYYIRRITISTGAVDYTAGASGYSTAWTNRVTESYSDFATTF